MNIHCLVCDKACSAVRLLSLPNMPSCAQNLCSVSDIGKDKGIDFNIVQCEECGLVQLDCPPVSYYKDVIRAGGGTSTMSDLRHRQYAQLIEMANLKGKRILEVGCGAGEFLAMLSGFPVLGYGIENKIELVNAAQNRGLNVYHDFADCKGHKIHGGPYDAFVQFNFIEHQPRPNDMVKCIHDNLIPDGWGLVTAPSFEYIMKNCVYEVMRDHIAYYTIGTLSHLFSKNGFNIMHSELVNGGDTISLFVKKRRILREDVFKPNYDAVKKEINDFVKERTDAGKKLSLWGASHQCFTAVSLLSEPSRIDYIIDSAPFKQGCVSPVSHIEIVSPAHFGQFPTDSILIVAPGYTEEIAKNIRVRFGGNVDIYALRTDRIEYMNV